jgi:hypothetical protein
MPAPVRITRFFIFSGLDELKLPKKIKLLKAES